MKKKNSFQFSFFFSAFASMEVPLEDRQCQVRSYGQVNGKKIFFLLLFNGKGKQRYMRFLEMNMSRIDLDMNTKSQDKYNVSK